MADALPNSVMYVKNGKGGAWWPTAKKEGQVHAGWKALPPDVIRNFDRNKIKDQYRDYYPNGSTQDLNALMRLLDHPSQHVWVTIQDGCLWWCTVHDNAEAGLAEDKSRGHFWLTCKQPWSDCSIGGRRLTLSDLPGPVTKVAGYRATVGKPGASQDILRVIRDEIDPNIMAVAHAREAYEQAIEKLIKDLSPKDFEHLVDMILIRSGWERISTLGGVQEGIDLVVENRAINERAFVQVKSEAGQKELNDYLGRFKTRRKDYGRIIFAVHTPRGVLHAPDDPTIRIWKGDETARLVVRLGLGERIEKMRG